MQNSGIIVNNDATLVSLGHITEGTALLAMLGLFITAGLVISFDMHARQVGFFPLNATSVTRFRRTLQRRIMDVTGMTPADYRALFTRDM